MILSDNLRGALYMMVAMAAFTLNDSGMKAATETMPLYEAIALRGGLTVAMLAMLGAAMGGLRHRLTRRDAAIIAVRTIAEIAATGLFLTALMHMPLANLSAILQSLPLAVTLGAALVLRRKHRLAADGRDPHRLRRSAADHPARNLGVRSLVGPRPCLGRLRRCP